MDQYRLIHVLGMIYLLQRVKIGIYSGLQITGDKPDFHPGTSDHQTTKGKRGFCLYSLKGKRH